MATSGVLKITTRLAKDKFKKDLKSLNTDIKSAETEMNTMESSTEAMSTGLGASVGSMAKIAVIAGLIIGAFLLIKKAVEHIVSKNEEIGAKIEAIKNALSNIGQGIITALANLILPIVEKIINGVYTILSYINAITKAWWGYDIFAENASESLSSGASSAKEIQKALAGFDTADVLGSSKSGGVSGTDVKNAKKYNGELAKIPKWLQKIIDLKPKLDTIFSKVENSAKKIWEWFSKCSPLAGFIRDGWDGVKTNIDNAITSVGKFFTKMKDEHPIITRLVEVMFPMLFIVDLISTNWDNIKSAIEKCVGWCKDLKNWFDKLADKTTDLLRDWGLIGEYVANSSSGMGHSGGGGRDGSSTTYSTGTTYNQSKLEKVVSALKKGAKGLFMASGGIVNNPGKGVALNQIVVGEKGPEAVLPLTDGTLQKLASMIPVQIELTNTIDGRVLSRRLETIRQNTAFSRNGG